MIVNFFPRNCRYDVEDPHATLCTGPAHSFVMTNCSPARKKEKDVNDSWTCVADLQTPFVIDVREDTFSILDHLLAEVWSDDLTGSSGCPPLQVEKNSPKNSDKFLLHYFFCLGARVSGSGLGQHLEAATPLMPAFRVPFTRPPVSWIQCAGKPQAKGC